MNYGIRLHDTAPGIFWDRLGYARRQGFNCVHLSLSKVLPHFAQEESPQRLTAHLAEQVRAALELQGLYCAALGCYMPLADPNGETLAQTHAIFRAHLRFGRMMGAEVVGTDTALRAAGADPHSEEALQLFLRCAAPLVHSAEEEGSILAIEPSADQIIDTPERVDRALSALDSDRVRVILDPVNLLTWDNWQQADAVIEDCLRRFGDRVTAVHVKDFVPDANARAVRPVVCGQGQMRYEPLLRFAMDRGLPLILENTAPDNAEGARLYLERRAGSRLAWAM